MHLYSGTRVTWTGSAVTLHASLLNPLSNKWMHWQAKAAGHPNCPARHEPDVKRLLAILQGRPEAKPSKHFADVTCVAPNTLAKPQPQPNLFHILNWQDQTGSCSPQSDSSSSHNINGIVEKIQLVTARHRSENETLAWPPAPELIANSPNWGPKTCAQPPTVPDLGLDFALPTTSTVSAGHFIGRDGTEWPLPPSECMPKPRLSQSPIAPPPGALPALTLDGDRWMTPIMALGGGHPDDAAPFVTCGDEICGKQGTASCSTAPASLPRTPGDDDVFLPVRRGSWKVAEVAECHPHPCYGVIGEGCPKPCPPTPFLGPSLRLPSLPFLGSQGAYAESEPELEGGYWSSSGSEYSDFDSNESDAWSGSDVHSALESDSDKEGNSEPDFFVGAPRQCRSLCPRPAAREGPSSAC